MTDVRNMRKLMEATSELWAIDAVHGADIETIVNETAEQSEQFSTDYVSIDIDDEGVWLSTDDTTIVFDRQQWDDFSNLIKGQGL